MSDWKQQDKRQIDEYKKHPYINLADSVNRSTVGDMRALTTGDWITRLLTVLVIVGGLLAFFLIK